MGKLEKVGSGFKTVGTFKVVERSLETGEIVGEFEEKNVITDVGIDHLLRSFSDSNHTNQMVQTISLGDDIGTGTILAPEQPTSDVSIEDHQLVYEVPIGEFFVSYPDNRTVRFFATVNGASVMENYPSEANVAYMSAMLKTGNAIPQAFAYKRFSARTISDLISVDISWEVEFVQV